MGKVLFFLLAFTNTLGERRKFYVFSLHNKRKVNVRILIVTNKSYFLNQVFAE